MKSEESSLENHQQQNIDISINNDNQNVGGDVNVVNHGAKSFGNDSWWVGIVIGGFAIVLASIGVFFAWKRGCFTHTTSSDDVSEEKRPQGHVSGANLNRKGSAHTPASTPASSELAVVDAGVFEIFFLLRLAPLT